MTAALVPASSFAAGPGYNGWVAVQLNGFPGKTVLRTPDGKKELPLFRHADEDFSPSWSPGGRKIVFVSTRDGDAEIYVMNADRSNVTRLTFYSGDDLYPSFTADGTQIRFIRDSELFVMDADGSDQQSLGDFTGQYPAWSPDGTQIAYGGIAGANFDIWVADADGSNAVDISNLTGNEFYPRWSADGSTVVFQSETGRQSAPADGSTPPTQFAFGGFNPPLPLFAPDGTAIAYQGGSDAWILNADGSFHKLVDAPVASPLAWQSTWVDIDPVSEATIDYGEKVPMTLRLYFGDDSDNDVVSLYRETAGPDVILAQGAVDSEGKVSFVVRPEAKTSYVAKWEGDAGHPGSTSAVPLLIQVHARALVYLSHAYGRDGKFRLYHAGRPVPITGTVRPKHTHTYISFLVERQLNSGKYRYVTSGNFGLRDKGAVTVAFYTQSIEKYRVRTSFRGDKDHLRDVSRWAYFRTTN